MRTKAQNREVLYADEPIVRVDRGDIQSLKALAAQNDRRRMRLCTHASPEALVHEMLIVHTPETYVRPHKHVHKVESFHVIEGQADVVIFDEVGNPAEIISMGDYASGLAFYYRLAEACYHTLLINSPVLVFHEVTNGPFRPADTVYAPWAPDFTELTAQPPYMQHLRQLTADSRPLPSETGGR